MGVITETERQKYFAYLDGVADGLNESRNDVNEVLEKIRAEIEALPRELPTDARNMVRRTRVLDIIDKYKAGRSK